MSADHPPIIARKGESVRLIKPIARYTPEEAKAQRIPEVGSVGRVLSVQVKTHHLLVEWPNRAWPVSVGPDEVEKVC